MTLTTSGLRRQSTLARPFSVSGPGLHTGHQSEVTVGPAPPDTGIIFQCGARRIPARASFVVSTHRCTCIGDGDVQIHTVEHLMSALAGMRIDNAEIRVEGPELPILDGSGMPWVSLIQSVGAETLDVEHRPLILTETLAMRDGDSWIVAVPADRFSISCVTHFDHPMLGTTAGTFVDCPEDYAAGIAPSRTFGFIHEIEALHRAGLAMGGTLDNALIIYEDRFSSPLRVPDEWLRHKVLDLFGDLALAGGLAHSAITAIMPGHRINARFAQLLAEKTSGPPGGK